MPGIVHALTGAIVVAEGNITESNQFSSNDTGRFFMRLQVESATGRDVFERALAPVIEKYGMTASLDIVGRPLRTLVLAQRRFPKAAFAAWLDRLAAARCVVGPRRDEAVAAVEALTDADRVGRGETDADAVQAADRDGVSERRADAESDGLGDALRVA